MSPRSSATSDDISDDDAIGSEGSHVSVEDVLISEHSPDDDEAFAPFKRHDSLTAIDWDFTLKKYVQLGIRLSLLKTEKRYHKHKLNPINKITKKTIESLLVTTRKNQQTINTNERISNDQVNNSHCVQQSSTRNPSNLLSNEERLEIQSEIDEIKHHNTSTSRAPRIMKATDQILRSSFQREDPSVHFTEKSGYEKKRSSKFVFHLRSSKDMDGKSHPTFTFHQYNSKLFYRIRSISDISYRDILDCLGNTPDQLDLRRSSGASKSGSIFIICDKFVIKSVTLSEMMFIRKTFARPFLKHLHRNPRSLLCRFLGLFKLTVKNHSIDPIGGQMGTGFRNRKSIIFRFVIMTNVFDLPCRIKYDLKGTTEDRLANQRTDDVLKDLNFSASFICVPNACRIDILDRIDADIRFLTKYHIMDYSLILGIHLVEKNSDCYKEIVSSFNSVSSAHDFTNKLPGYFDEDFVIFCVGIIDILQEYTMKKKAAHWLKKCTIGCCHEIDTEPPLYYSKRFRSYIDNKLIGM